MTTKLFFLVLFFLLNQTKIFSQNSQFNFPHPEWSYNLSIYEANIRQFTPEGNFNAFIKHLHELKELGVGIIWLMPIHPIGEENRKGTLGSYYSVKDYFDVNPEFGTKEDFKTLVDSIHSLGMFVIIDWVANHSSWDNDWTKSHPDFYRKDSSGNFVPPLGTDWSDVIDFDYSNQNLRSEMISALKFWVEKFNIDGYRCDVAARVPTDFWETVRTELNKIKPVFMLAEAHEAELHNKAFDMTYCWQLKDLINDIPKGKKSVADIFTLSKKEQSHYPNHAFRMTFTSNHDENSWHKTEMERLGIGFEAFAVLTYLFPGMPLIYNGQEAASDKSLSFFEKDLIDWKYHPIADVYKKLNLLKKKNSALWNGEKGSPLIELKNDNNKKIFSAIRTNDNNSVISIINLSDEKISVTVELPFEELYMADVFSGSLFHLQKKTIFDLQPWEYRIFSK